MISPRHPGTPERRTIRRARIFVVQRDAYVSLVPLVEDERRLRLTTMKVDANEKNLLESVEQGNGGP